MNRHLILSLATSHIHPTATQTADKAKLSFVQRHLGFAMPFALALFAILSAGTAQAQDLYWDGVDTTSDADGGTGTWDNGTTSNWDDAATSGVDTAWNNATPDSAIFGGTAGTVTLGEAITADSLQFDTTGYIVTGNTLTLSGSSTITANADATIGSTLGGSSGLTKEGTGTLTLKPLTGSGGRVAPDGGVTINGGTLLYDLADAGNDRALSDDYTINNGSSLVFDGNGNGSRQIFTNSTFTYGSTGGGTITFNNMNPIVRNNVFTTTGGATNFMDGSAALNGQGANVTFNVASGTDAVGLEFSGNANNLKLVKTGAGVMSITSGSNNISKGIQINNGTLEISGSSGRLGAGTYTPDILNNGIFKHSSDLGQTLSGNMTGSGSLTKDNSSSTLTLSGNNSYSGSTTISAGTLQLGDGGTTGSLTGTTGITNDGNLTINRSDAFDQTTDLNGQVITGTGTFTQSGSGTTSLTGANTYTGVTTISAGTLQADVADVASTSGALGNGGDITFTGGTLQYTANSAGSDYSARIKNSTSAITFDTNGQDVTLATKFANTNTGGLTKLGTGELSVVLSKSSYTGITKVDGGTLVLGNSTELNENTSSSGFEINNGSTLRIERGAQGNLIQNKTFTFDSNGGGALEVNGSTGVLWRNNTIVTNGGSQNTFSGTTSVNVQNNENNAGTQARTMTFDVADGSDDVDLLVSIRVDNAKFVKNGAGTVSLTSNNTMDGVSKTATINEGVFELAGSGRLNAGNYNSAIAINGANSIFRHSGAGQTLGGNITGTGSLEKIDGLGQLTLSGNSTYSGTTTVGDGVGTEDSLLFAGSTTGLSSSSAFTVNSDGVLLLNDFDNTIGSLAGAGIVRNANSGTTAATLTIGNNGTDTTFSGVIQDGGGGALSITKIGSGTQTFSGNNSYSGATTVSGGTLVVNGQSSGAGTVTVEVGATLGGIGEVAGNIVVDSGGFLATGNSIGTLTANGNVDLNGTMLVELDGTGAGLADLLVVDGLLDINNAILDFSILTALDDASYIFASYGTLSGTFQTVNNQPAGYTIDYAFGGNNIALVSAVPEPGALTFLGFCLVGIAARRRRQK